MNRTRLAPLAAVVFESRVLRTSGTAVQRRGWTGEKEKGRERERGGEEKRERKGVEETRTGGPPWVVEAESRATSAMNNTGNF